MGKWEEGTLKRRTSTPPGAEGRARVVGGWVGGWEEGTLKRRTSTPPEWEGRLLLRVVALVLVLRVVLLLWGWVGGWVGGWVERAQEAGAGNL